MSKVNSQVQISLASFRNEIYTKDTESGPAVFGRISGYRILAHTAGLKLLTPPRLVYNNEERSNPHIVRDNGRLIEVVSRKIAFGFDHNGEPVAVDQTIVFNPLNYLARTLLELAHMYPTIAKMINRASILPKELKAGMFISVIDSGVTDIGVFVPNLGHPELDDVWKKYNESVLYSERNAQTMCERSAIQKHPAIPALNISMMIEEDVLSVGITSWTLSGEDSSRMSNIASNIELGKPVDIKTTVSIDEAKEH